MEVNCWLTTTCINRPHKRRDATLKRAERVSVEALINLNHFPAICLSLQFFSLRRFHLSDITDCGGVV